MSLKLKGICSPHLTLHVILNKQRTSGYIFWILNCETSKSVKQPKQPEEDWVNPSKREGMDGVFQGLAGLPEEQPCQSKENSVLPNSFTGIYILFQIGFFSSYFQKSDKMQSRNYFLQALLRPLLMQNIKFADNFFLLQILFRTILFNFCLVEGAL